MSKYQRVTALMDSHVRSMGSIVGGAEKHVPCCLAGHAEDKPEYGERGSNITV
jgi:hypothetical protein